MIEVGVLRSKLLAVGASSVSDTDVNSGLTLLLVKIIFIAS